MAAMHSLGGLGQLGGDLYNQNNQSEAGPEQENLSTTDGAAYDSRTITKQTLSKLQINSKFGTFTRKTCESIEKFNFNNPEDDNTGSCQNGSDGDTEAVTGSTRHGGANRYANGCDNSDVRHDNEDHQRPPSAAMTENYGADSDVTVRQPLNGSLHGGRPLRNPSPNANRKEPSSQERRPSPSRQQSNQVAELEKEVETLKAYLNDALTERDQAVAALRAYEELLKRINEVNVKQKRSSTSSLGSGGSSQKDGATSNPPAIDTERLVKKNAMLEKTVDNLEQTVQDTMARMNDVKDVNQELKTVLTDQQDMLAQYKSTIEQKTFEYRDLLAKHEAHIDALVTEHKRDRALLEKQITLLRAEAHMKSLDNERLASECRIKGEQLARMSEMLTELRQAY